jgi:hypothetical protein
MKNWYEIASPLARNDRKTRARNDRKISKKESGKD